jgi:release factor glutamine methyltransferase
MHVEQALNEGVTVLAAVTDSPRMDAELMLATAMQRSRTYLYAHPEAELSPKVFKLWQHFLQKRQAHYPLAYLLGQKEFWSIDFKLSPHTLIPRPATEALIEYILGFYRRHSQLRVCDLGTGSGAIALSLAKACPQWQITAVDLQAATLAMAAWNAKNHQCHNVEFICSHWFKRLPYKTFDLIVANPPYIDETDPHLHQGDVAYEPKLALVSAKQGMQDLGLIMQQSLAHLQPEGQLVLEHGYNQQQQVMTELTQFGYQAVGGGQDQDHLPRFSYGFRP